jgi:hypothetical protein
MAVDYLKTYLGIDPNDYSSMEARIRGEEPQAQAPIMMRQPMMMPQQRSLGDIEAMQMMPRQQPAPQPAPQVDDRYQGLMDQIAALRSQIEGMQAPVVEEAPVMAPTPAVVEAPTPAPAVMSEPFQAPPEIENRAVGEPEPIPQAPAEDIQASINYLASLPKMNIPQIPDIEEIKRKMAEANMNFPEPVSYPDQLQAIRDLPPMNQMPTREEIQMAMQNMPPPPQKPTGQITDMLMRNPDGSPMMGSGPGMNFGGMGMPSNKELLNPPTQQLRPDKLRPPLTKPNLPALIPIDSRPALPVAQTIQEKIQMAMQNMPTPTAPVSSMPKFNLPQMQSFGLPQKIAGGRTLMSDFSPRNVMRMAGGGGIDQAIYDLKFKLNG